MQVELRADRGITHAGAPTVVDQIILALAAIRDRPKISVDAAQAEAAKDLNAVGGAKREHGADVGDVGKILAAVERDALRAEGEIALGQRLRERHEPEARVADDGATARPRVLC